jgi:hypothetical protein
MAHLRQFRLASDELREAPSHRTLQSRAQRSQTGDLVNVDRLTNALDPGRSQRLNREVTFDQFAQGLADRDRSRSCERLQSRRKTRVDYNAGATTAFDWTRFESLGDALVDLDTVELILAHQPVTASYSVKGSGTVICCYAGQSSRDTSGFAFDSASGADGWR